MEKYFSCGEVAQRYGVKTNTVWNWIREEKLMAINTGSELQGTKYSISPQALKEFEESRATMKKKGA